MEITNLKFTDMPVETTTVDLTLPTETKEPSRFVFTGCKGLMLADFESIPTTTPFITATVEPIAVIVEL